MGHYLEDANAPKLKEAVENGEIDAITEQLSLRLLSIMDRYVIPCDPRVTITMDHSVSFCFIIPPIRATIECWDDGFAADFRDAGSILFGSSKFDSDRKSIEDALAKIISYLNKK